MYDMNWDWFFFGDDDDEWPFNMNPRRNRRIPPHYRFNRPHYIGNPMKSWKDILREALPKIREEMENNKVISNETRITMKRDGRTFEITIKEIVDDAEEKADEEKEVENVEAEEADFDEDFAEENA